MGAAGAGAYGQMAGNAVALAAQIEANRRQIRSLQVLGRDVQRLAQQEAQSVRARLAARRARNRSAYARAGVRLDQGTPVDVIAEQAAKDEFAARTVEVAGYNQKLALRNQIDSIKEATLFAALGTASSAALSGAAISVQQQNAGATTIGQQPTVQGGLGESSRRLDVNALEQILGPGSRDAYPLLLGRTGG